MPIHPCNKHKVGDSRSVGLGHRALKTFAIYPSDRAQALRQSVTIFFFSFLFLFLFFLFERLIGLLFRGPGLLKVVKGTRLDFCRAEETRQFFNL